MLASRLSTALLLVTLSGCGGCRGGGDPESEDAGRVDAADSATALDGSPDGGEPGPTAEICDNGVDDDEDGDVDCQDIECAAAPLDPAAFATADEVPFIDRVRFLWEGAACEPIQQDVEPGAITADRVVVARGRVLDTDGSPFVGARVEAVGQPEVGYSLSRGDGQFDLAVLGPRPVTLRITAEGRIEAHRRIDPARPGEYAHAEDVALLEPGEPVTLPLGPGGVVEAASNEDGDGRRGVTLFVPAGLGASASGSSLGDELTIRPREMTVGALGPDAMTAELPATSGYTYAVDFDTGDAEGVRFDRPLPIYVDNFLAFPVGTAVPVGSYDRDETRWKPERDGVVLEVLATDGGRAELDLDGDGEAETPETLEAFGITDEEREQVAATHAAGETFWRFAPTHFSTWDLNWAVAFAEDAIDVALELLGLDAFFEDTCATGSQIRVERQVLGEDVPIVGSSMTLHYASDRQLGYESSRTLRFRVTPDSIPGSLRRIRIVFEIAGRRVEETLDPEPNLIWEYTWDGLDAYGRRFRGPAPYRINVGYDYPARYSTGVARGDAGLREFEASFGLGGERILTGNPARMELTAWRQVRRTLVVDDARLEGFLGLTLSSHHRFEPTGQTLLRGDGGRVAGNALPLIIDRVAGGGTDTSDGAPALDFRFRGIRGLAADGQDLYVSSADNRIWRVDGEGLVHHVGGTGDATTSGDGGPATDAGIAHPWSLSVGPDGSLYLACAVLGVGDECRRLRRIRPDGVIETVAGNGDGGNALRNEGDGLAAVEAPLQEPRLVAVGSDGAVYFADGALKLRMVGTDGILRTLNVARDSSDEGTPLARADLGFIDALAVGPDDALYIGSRRDGGVIYRFGADRRLQRIAGGNGLPDPDSGAVAGQSAIDAQLGGPTQLTVGDDGTVWMAVGVAGAWIRRITPEGMLEDIAGRRSRVASGDGGAAGSANFVGIGQLALGAGGALYLTDLNPTNTIRRIAPSFGSENAGEWVVPSGDGQVRYVFDAAGRHLRTETADLGYPLLAFRYDERGRVAAVDDADGNSMLVDRPNARTVVLSPPEGPPTRLVDEDGDGYADRVEIDGDDPERAIRMEWDEGGLLRRFEDRFGIAHTFGYDEVGRLVSDGFEGYPQQRLEPIESADGTRTGVRLTTAAGRPRTHLAVREGPTQRRVFEDGVGLQSQQYRDVTGAEVTTEPNGTTTRTVYRPDPVLGAGARVPIESEMTTPSGRSFRSEMSYAVDLSEGRLQRRATTATVAPGTPSQGTVVQELIANADGSATYRATSGEGRVGEMDVDERGRMTELRRPGRHPIRYEYDGFGRIERIVQGPEGSPELARVVTFDRGPLPSSEFQQVVVRDATGQRVITDFDALGRIETVADDVGTVARTYDDARRQHAVVPPGRPAHTFEHDDRGRLQSYRPPAVGGETAAGYQYDDDAVPTRSIMPDGVTVETRVDVAFRPERAEVIAGTVAERATGVRTTYDAVGQVEQMVWSQPSAEARIEPAFDGALLEALTTSGATRTRVDFTYDDAMRTRSVEVSAGGTRRAMGYEFDRDGMPVEVVVEGERFRIEREPDGDREGLDVRGTSTTSLVDGFGMMVEERVSWPGGELGWQWVPDRAGRVARRIETDAEPWTYEYDDAGRLESVRVGSVERYRYGYDANGNRTSWSTPEGSCDADCVEIDDQDRLLRHGSVRYGYDDRGRRTTRTTGGETTRYEYDPFGNLASVQGPGVDVRYVVDALGRRIARDEGGVRTRGWVYGTGLSPLGQLDASGRLEVLFVYATKDWVPDLALHRDGTLYRVVTDNVGSVRAVVDVDTGEVVQEYEYSPFGVVERAVESREVVPFRFAGGLWDDATGLLRFGARDYDPEVGRWTAKDPIGFAGGDSNLYAYVGNDPVNAIDPTGLIVDTIADAGAVAGCVYAVFRDNVFGSCDNLGSNATRCALAVAAFIIPGVAYGMLHMFGKLARRMAGRFARRLDGCFAAGTLVAVFGAASDAVEPQPIEQVQVGDRVETAVRHREQTPETRVSPDWRVYDVATEDGQTLLTLLRPPGWLERSDPSGDGRIHLDIPEIAFSGWASVVAERGAPSVSDGPGRVVLATMRRANVAVHELHFSRGEPIVATPNHPFWSLDRASWVFAGDLHDGERVATLDGEVVLESQRALSGTRPVFNLQVEHDHEYLVGAEWLRVHNYPGQQHLPVFDAAPHPALPPYPGRGPTRGIFSDGIDEVPLRSGDGPGAHMPPGSPGFNGNVRKHVEGHAAAVMRQRGIDKATLFINQEPCSRGQGCSQMLEHMLPPGAILEVIGPNGYRRVFIGNGR